MFSFSFASANDLENKYTAIPWETYLAMLDYTGWELYFTFCLFIIHLSPVHKAPMVMRQADLVGSLCPRAGNISLRQEMRDDRWSQRDKEVQGDN